MFAEQLCERAALPAGGGVGEGQLVPVSLWCLPQVCGVYAQLWHARANSSA